MKDFGSKQLIDISLGLRRTQLRGAQLFIHNNIKTIIMFTAQLNIFLPCE